MGRSLYALLVGINDYAPEVGRLTGCVNDVDHFQDYLNQNFPKTELRIEVLKDSDATRDNIIKQFREHLGKAKKNDVVVFQYCGHGARWSSASAFKEFYPDGKDEGLVCYDSRRENGNYPYDLADKELAVLLQEVARNDPHLAVILDCCHSGSATRSADDFTQLKARQTHEVSEERPLDSYLDGYYTKLKKAGSPLFIPTSKHILLAACDRTQKAWEGKDHSGVFTSTFLEVLNKAGSNISYADLFIRSRAVVRKRAYNQDPQFEAIENFNAWSGFLGSDPGQKSRKYHVIFDKGMWQVDCGALHGLSSDPDKPIRFAIYPDDADVSPGQKTIDPIGNAEISSVGPQKSVVDLTFTPDASARYVAEMTSVPFAPVPVFVSGDEEGIKSLKSALKPDTGIILTDHPEGCKYGLMATDNQLHFKQLDLDALIQGVDGQKSDDATRLYTIVKQVMQWERSLALENGQTKLDPSEVDFKFHEILENGKEHAYTDEEITLDFVKRDNEWQKIRCKFKARNRSPQQLHVTLAYFSRKYGVSILRNEPLDPGQEMTLWGEDPRHALGLRDNINESTDIFKLIVSTEKVDDFLLVQKPIKLGQILPPTRDLFGDDDEEEREKITNDWFTKTIRVQTVRQVDQVDNKDSTLADGKITIKGHPSIKANLSLAAAKNPTRGVGQGGDIHRALEAGGMKLLNFSATRGDNESILELTDIENHQSLKEHPLEIELNTQLTENEYILPLVFDGEHIILGGDPSKDEQGNTHISISEIPEVPDNRRSVARSLKLYFFKTYLEQDNVNLLRAVTFDTEGKPVFETNGIAQKVSDARNILLVIHGIIGDTRPLVAGLPPAKDEQGKSLADRFDLILTYDYENLSTTIAQTAKDLKAALVAAGFAADDQIKLTILAHSMGGLVSRWMIEQEGGNQLVDHLVMCGTPNNGSPYGKIDLARKAMNMLTMVSINFFPAFAAVGGAIITALNRSKKITAALEDMNPSSDFMKDLNGSDDPCIRYTILAGDIKQYQDPGDNLFPKLLDKAGKGKLFDLLFGNARHDIAVSVDSILGVDSQRNPAPLRQEISCHHLNYLTAEAGIEALSKALK